MMDMYGGSGTYTLKPTKVDAFVVRVSENAEILNLKELETWIGNDGYFQYNVYWNNSLGNVVKVFNHQTQKVEFRNLEDMDVLFYTLGKDGERMNAMSEPVWDSNVDFVAKFN